MSGNDFLKASNAPLGPSKSVNVDHKEAMDYLKQAGCGGLYAGGSVCELEPKIVCPNCQKTFERLSDCGTEYPYPSSVSKPDMATGEPSRFAYSLEPCGCRVSQEWAGALQAEMNRRLEGKPPQAVVDFTPAQREKRRVHLQKHITELMKLQKAASSNDANLQKSLQYKLVGAVDQLMRLYPGTHNQVVSATTLAPEVQSWADKYKFHKPLDPYQMATYKAAAVAGHWENGTSAGPDNCNPKSPGGYGKDNGYSANYPMPKGMNPNVKAEAPSELSLATMRYEQRKTMLAYQQQQIAGYPSGPVRTQLDMEIQQTQAEMLALQCKIAKFIPAATVPAPAPAPAPGVKLADLQQIWDTEVKQQSCSVKLQRLDALNAMAKNVSTSASDRSVLIAFVADKINEMQQGYVVSVSTTKDGPAYVWPVVWLKQVLLLSKDKPKQFSDTVYTLSMQGVDTAVELAATVSFIRKNLGNHLGHDEPLAERTRLFIAALADIAKLPSGETVKLVEGPVGSKPPSGAVDSPVLPQTTEEFHAGFKRKKRTIRRLKE